MKYQGARELIKRGYTYNQIKEVFEIAKQWRYNYDA